MTQNTQTTAERIESILRRDLDVDVIVSRGGDPHYNEADIVGVNIAAQAIAAEIDALKAEVERLRPAAEAWEASRAFSDLMGMDASDPTADGYRPVTDDEIIAASIACQKADAAARAAKVTP